MKEKTANQYKKALKQLTESVLAFENLLDKEMKKPSTSERGKNIAKLTNALTEVNQQAMLYTLGYSIAKVGKLYGVAPTQEQTDVNETKEIEDGRLE